MIGSFDKRLSQLDAYLQMLIEQGDFLDEKIELNVINQSERDSLTLIKSNLDSLVSSIKHSIVLLQIAKVSIESSPKLDEKASHANHKGSSYLGKTSKFSKLRGKLSSESNSSLVSEVLNSTSKGDKLETKLPLESSGESSEQPPPPPPSRTFRRHTSTSDSTNSVTLPSPSTQPSSKAYKNHPSSISHQQPSTTASQTSGSSIQLHQHTTTSKLQQEQQLSIQHQHESVDELTQCHTNGYHEEDDDAFFDADEHQQQQYHICDLNTDIDQTSTSESTLPNYKTNLEKQQQAIEPQVLLNNNNNNNNIISVMAALDVAKREEDKINWDLIYEEEGEEDLGSLENHGSVIKHLLSQIRIGMDLTKVVLPTFILERRSLLEMYADFFAHPDLFSSIPDYDTPEDRLIQLVKWYLSAFHAGRKSSVAKKPYNPVLGEIFLCNWNLSENDEDQSTSNKQQNKLSSNINSTATTLQEPGSTSTPDRSSPTSNRLTFVAEQVSHHPPISAFYAENPEKSISCSAHIYTKSKYLGLSVGVHNIGEGIVSLLKYNENYVCTFPSAYGRSILTVPWVELGGSVHITCKETGYSANIDFLTKPFYGGKKHRVTAELVRPNGQTFMAIEGEWNGCMHFKSPPNSSDKKVFVDTANLPVIKKNVKPVGLQEPLESRNVWKEVTRALKIQDVTSATNAKSFIEQRQRDLLKERLEKGQKWRPRYFEGVDEGWFYTSPLADRLSKDNLNKQ